MSAAVVTTDPMLRRSADSAAMLDYWNQTDTIVDGIKAMRAAGKDYLPQFVDEDKDDYKYRLSVTKMTNVYRDIVEGLASKPFEQEVALKDNEAQKVPDALLKFSEDVDGSGNNLTGFLSHTFFNGINSAVDWIFVDFSKVDTKKVRTVADAKAAGVRVFWTHVLGRNVLEAKSKVTDGNERLIYVRVFEPGKPDHVRVFERDEDSGVITWMLYEKRDATRPLHEGSTEVTQFWEVDGATLGIDEIPMVPFATGRRDGRTFRYFPSLQDAADLQVEVYQQESALKFAKQLTAYPMLSGEGVTPAKDADGTPKRVAVGPSRVLYGGIGKDGKAGSWKYVEPTAASLKFLAEDIKDTIQQLRELGKQPLTAQSAQLTVITTQVAAGKAKSAVGAWALNLKNAAENAFVITCKWMNIQVAIYDPVVEVFTEFDDFLDGKDLEDLNVMRKNGDLSQLTYWQEKKRRKVLSPDFDADTERKQLLKETPGDPYAEPPETDPDNDPVVSKLPAVG